MATGVAEAAGATLSLVELLDQPSVTQPELTAQFPQPAVIRDGWLILRPTP